MQFIKIWFQRTKSIDVKQLWDENHQADAFPDCS